MKARKAIASILTCAVATGYFGFEARDRLEHNASTLGAAAVQYCKKYDTRAGDLTKRSLECMKTGEAPNGQVVRLPGVAVGDSANSIQIATEFNSYDIQVTIAWVCIGAMLGLGIAARYKYI